MTAPTPFRPRVEQGSEPLADLPPDQVRRIEEKLDRELAEFERDAARPSPTGARWLVGLIVAGGLGLTVGILLISLA